MKVLRINEGALSDFEVLQLMQERREQRLHKSAMVAYAERNWMDHKVLKFLTHTHSRCATLTTPRVDEFLRGVDEAGLTLTPAEKLQFLNHCPTELVDVHLIVEDCATRFTEAQINALTTLVEDTLAAGLSTQSEEDQSR